ncbi:MAG: di-heme enzyme [Gemmatimonadota bacterium]
MSVSIPSATKGWRVAALAAALGSAAFGACGGDETLGPLFTDPGVGGSFEWGLPAGFPAPRVPADNPMTAEKVELGRHLFYDTRLSGNQTQSCASCHDQALAFSDPRPVAVGSTGQSHPRNSMSLANVGYQPVLTWANPLLEDLAQQALIPMFGEDPVELGMSGREAELLDRLRADTLYQRLFPVAFSAEADPWSLASITRALAAFQRTLISGNAPVDRARRGEPGALSAEAQLGQALFFSERLECFHCHGGLFFTGTSDFEGKSSPEIEFHNTGLYNLDGNGAYPEPNTGLYTFTGRLEDMGRFKAPSLRNIELTAPYMHDGSIATLDEVIDHYAAGGRTIAAGPWAGVGSANPHKSGFVNGFTLTDQERAGLKAYLRALTDPDFVSDPRFSDPWVARGGVGR